MRSQFVLTFMLIGFASLTAGCSKNFSLSIEKLQEDSTAAPTLIPTPTPTPTPSPTPTPPTVSWSASNNSVSESVGSVTLTASLSAPTTATVSVPFAVSSLSTAAEGFAQDYTISISPLVIAAGSTSADVTITINDDSTSEADESIIIEMGTPVNATAGSTTTHTLTVLANDAVSAFSISGITGGIDTTADAWLQDSANVPTVNWADATGESSYDVVIYEQDGTTVKCPSVNVSADVTSHTFTGCTLSVGTSYKASVIAKSVTQTQAASNNQFLFSTNPIAVVADANVFGSTVPATEDAGDASAVELGMRFRTSVAGKILGVRFYKSVDNTGPHTGTLWSNDGNLLSTVTFSGETSSGWQEQRFAAPVEIEADTTYVISYHTDSGHYSAQGNAFNTEIVNGTDGLVHGLAHGTDGANGVFKYGASAFPDGTFNKTNYFVDVIFDNRTTQAPHPFTISGVSGGTDSTPDSILQAVADPDLTWTASYGATTYEATIYELDGTTVKCPTVTVNAPTVHHLFTGCSLTTGAHYKAKVIAKDALLTATTATNSLFVFHAQGPTKPIIPMQVQSEWRADPAATSVVRSFSTDNTAGNLIVAVCRSGSTTGTLSVSDSAGNAYQTVTSSSHAAIGQMTLFYAKAILSGANTVTCTSTTSTSLTMVISEYQGLDSVSPLATQSTNSGNSASLAGTVTTTSPFDLIVHVGMHESGESRADTRFLTRYPNSGGTFSDRVEPVPGTHTATDKLIDPGTGLESAQNWLSIDAVFKSAGATGTPASSLLIVGGFNLFNENQKAVMRSIDGGASWTSIAQFPIAISSHCTLNFNGGLYVLGGSDGSKQLKSVYRSLDNGLHWDLIGQLPDRRVGHACVVYNSKMWVLGGRNSDPGKGATDTVWSSSDGVTWTSVGTLPYARAYGNAAVFSNRIYYVGGQISSFANVGTVTSSTDGVTWSATDPALQGGKQLSQGALLSFNSKLWYIGGYGVGQQDVETCDDPCTSWTTIGSLGANFFAGPSAVFNGKMVLVPGGGGLGAVYSSSDGTFNWVNTLPYQASSPGELRYTDMISW